MPRDRFDLIWEVDTDAKTFNESTQDCASLGLFSNGTIHSNSTSSFYRQRHHRHHYGHHRAGHQYGGHHHRHNSSDSQRYSESENLAVPAQSSISCPTTTNTWSLKNVAVIFTPFLILAGVVVGFFMYHLYQQPRKDAKFPKRAFNYWINLLLYLFKFYYRLNVLLKPPLSSPLTLLTTCPRNALYTFNLPLLTSCILAPAGWAWSLSL